MELLLVVVFASLTVIVLIVLFWMSRRERSLDVQGWHRKLRMLRETAQPGEEPVPDDKLIVDVSQRNVRVLDDPAGEVHSDAAEEPQQSQEPPWAAEVPDGGAEDASGERHHDTAESTGNAAPASGRAQVAPQARGKAKNRPARKR